MELLRSEDYVQFMPFPYYSLTQKVNENNFAAKDYQVKLNVGVITRVCYCPCLFQGHPL